MEGCLPHKNGLTQNKHELLSQLQSILTVLITQLTKPCKIHNMKHDHNITFTLPITAKMCPQNKTKSTTDNNQIKTYTEII